ncbi:MAG: transcription elongation factor GreA [Eubacterium sp.]|nr:transcription elongation factor GreA [Eubacterium sp.]
MVEAKKHILTSKGMQALEDELQDLKVVKRKEIAQKIKEAREQGDLSENAEYDAAKDEQRSMEARIEELEKIIKNAEVIDESAYDKDTVSIGSTIKFYDEEFDEELEYRIVGSTESDILKGLISNESPLGKALIALGKALIGAKVGETVQVESPDGFSRYKILEISRS